MGKRGTAEQVSSQTALGPKVWQPEDITVLDVDRHRAVRLTEDGRTFGRREHVVDNDPDSARSATLCNFCSKAETLKRTTHAHHAPKCFSCVCHSHDEGMWDTAIPCWMESPAANEAESQQLSTLPMRMGGLRSTATCAPVSCLAWWADALT